MAKGKQAAEAARRKYEMAMEHIDRLTEQVADYKVRTKMVESLATRAATLEKENTHFKALIDGNTSDEVLRLQTTRDERLDKLQSEYDLLVKITTSVIERLFNQLPDDAEFATQEELDFFRTRRLSVILDLVDGESANRRLRRHHAAGRKNDDLIRQDNRKSFGENFVNARPFVPEPGFYSLPSSD